MSWAWSLCVEEHFYLLLPPILFLLYRVPRRALRPALLSLIVAAPLAGRALQYVADPSIDLVGGFYYYSHNRFDELFVGVLVAYLFVNHRDAFRSWAERRGSALWIAGLGCVAAVWAFGGLQERGAFAVAAQFSLMALGTGLLVVNCLFLENAATRFFSHALWFPLARVSYGLYLVHPFVLFGLLALYLRGGSLSDLGPGDVVGLYVLVMALSFLIASAMFVWVEAPLLRLGARTSARSRARARAWDVRDPDVEALPADPSPR
jgi:peptidoglycan/LPS O-acetylase OafA/YrhL